MIILSFLNWFIPVLLIAGLLLFFRIPVPSQINSHWNKLFESFNYSVEDFYEKVRNNIKQREIPGLDAMSTVMKPEGRMWPPGAMRKYLRVSRDDVNYFICAAPFGTGFFVSWWRLESWTILKYILFHIPVIDTYIKATTSPQTFYKTDTEAMFMAAVQQAFNEAVDEMTKCSNIVLSEEQKKPLMDKMFAR